MSDKQLSAFLEALNLDAGLQEKLIGAADLDAAVAIARQVGFDVSKADFLKAQASQILELRDEELAGAVGGIQYQLNHYPGQVVTPLIQNPGAE